MARRRSIEVALVEAPWDGVRLLGRDTVSEATVFCHEISEKWEAGRQGSTTCGFGGDAMLE